MGLAVRTFMTAAATAAVAALLAAPAAGAASSAEPSPVAESRVYHLNWTLTPCATVDRFEIFPAAHEWMLTCQGSTVWFAESVRGTYTQDGPVTKFTAGSSISSFNFAFYGVPNLLRTRYVGAFDIIAPELVTIIPGLFSLTEI
ncbi:MAG TPA: hypothetical protein VL979_03480 [Solirubrobacteraceae bacterium]|nr:hypothetical protein [Solirubrobacteraceae bacterium]